MPTERLPQPYSHHLWTDENHVPPTTIEFETHKHAWRGLLVLSIIALLAMIAVMVARG